MGRTIDNAARDRIEESIRNFPVGFEDGTVMCSECGSRRRVIPETGSETFYARVENNPRSGRVQVGAVYCDDCENTTIRTPTRGIHEARVEVEVDPNPVSTPVIATLVAVHDYSSADDGVP